MVDRLVAAVAALLDRLVAAVAAVVDRLVAAVVDRLVAAVAVLAVAAERRHCPAALASAERPAEVRAVGTPCTHSGRCRPRQRASCLRARWAGVRESLGRRDRQLVSRSLLKGRVKTKSRCYRVKTKIEVLSK